MTDADEISERWRECCADLYKDKDKEQIEEQFEREAPPFRSEMAKALRETASGKRTGRDDVLVVQMFKQDLVMSQLYSCLNRT